VKSTSSWGAGSVYVFVGWISAQGQSPEYPSSTRREYILVGSSCGIPAADGRQSLLRRLASDLQVSAYQASASVTNQYNSRCCDGIISVTAWRLLDSRSNLFVSQTLIASNPDAITNGGSQAGSPCRQTVRQRFDALPKSDEARTCLKPRRESARRVPQRRFWQGGSCPFGGRDYRLGHAWSRSFQYGSCHLVVGTTGLATRRVDVAKYPATQTYPR
jgi:hypothetical protein